MGKVRRSRQKYHSAAVKCDEKKDEKPQTNPNVGKFPLSLPPIFPSEGLFSGTKIDVDKLITNPTVKKDKDIDVKSTISSRSESGQMKKKDRRKQRHEQWLQKIETIKTLRKKEKEAKKRAKTPIVGDLQLLSDALPDLTEYFKTSKRNKRPEKKHRPTPSTKDRQKLMNEEVAKFRQVQNNSSFKTSPLTSIKEQLRNQMLQEEHMDQG
ncbi:ribosome biogenesis protein SLX9 homolog [Ptychodera flava]|uniref:ribosome biogenesis protein SLX9 homolog n=1 Tax=Ptychodera flava TaxID=63121 RepID=UPI003969EB31